MQIRLFVPDDLFPDAGIFLSEAQAHYLRSVLRASEGTEVFLFNGKDGEFSGRMLQ